VTELGNRLKEARLAKDLSLDDLQSMTKIQKRYLVGIEEGNYSSMPGNFYVRAFIKQYVEALQLNPDEIFEAYKNEIPASYHEELPDQLSRVKTQKSITEGHSKFFDILPKIVVVVFVLVAAGLLYLFLQNHPGNKSNESINKPTDPVTQEQSDILKNANGNEKANTNKNDSGKVKNPPSNNEENPPVVVTPQQELAVVGSSGINSTYALKNADKFDVKLVSRGKTWVNVKNNQGKSYFQGTLTTDGTASQTVDLSSETEAVIVVGRAIDTDIYVNDQKLEYAIAPADVVRQNITIQFVPKNK
jgi:cytoskeletal protein RodZ